jgi:heterodisulfide reductase subunit A-like polyferredoxin
VGVEIRLNQALGRDFSIESLRADGYQAIFMGVGAHHCLSLGIEGEDARGAKPGVEFLREAGLGRAKSPGQKVVVVGGGNVAVDSARSALRLGSREVTILYRRTREEMPAYEEEIEEALEEGISIEYLAAPLRFLKRGEKLIGVEAIRMELGEPDESGRRSPVPIKGSEYTIDCDGALMSIGQEPDMDCLDDTCTLEISPRNCLQADPVTLQTAEPDIFAGGDAVLGPATVVQAIAQGKEAAISIQRYLNGEDLAKGRETDWEIARPETGSTEAQARQTPPMNDPEERVQGFGEVMGGFDEETAQKEASRCLACGRCAECLLCEPACLAGAVIHDEKPRSLDLEVGAVILAPGASAFDTKKLDANYQYGLNPAVITSLEFERILSPSGPFQGHLVRPGDKAEPKSIAWIQCVGSRNVKPGDHGYCSSVCCMYAIKQALVAKEHSDGELDCTIFNMDVRTFGKDYELYYNRAQDQGVNFIKARAHTIYGDVEGGGARIEYATDQGEARSDHFDLVILSLGLETSGQVHEMAQRLGVKLSGDGFIESDTFSPVETSREGVYACGVFSGPKDIPASVTEASAAAAAAGASLSPARHRQEVDAVLPDELDVSGQEPRVGVFVCHCGINIAGVVDVAAVHEYAASLPYVAHVEEGLFTCSQDVQETIKQCIEEHRLNRLVVAACSPKTHEPIFRETMAGAGLNKYLFEMANIRNHNSWVHAADPELATGKAKDLVRMAVARVSTLNPLSEESVEVTPKALVVGGGPAGMTAALNLAEQGFESLLVEKENALGGFANNLHHTIEGADVPGMLSGLSKEVQKHPLIEVMLDARVSGFTGFGGNFKSSITSGDGESREYEHGAVIVAAGAHEYQPTEYLYGQDPRVMSQVELGHRLEESGPQDWDVVLMIQCVGSRNEEHPNCSRICCQSAVKNALAIKAADPECVVGVLYRDMRTYGLMEKYYTKAREAGVLFFRYNQDDPPKVEKRGDAIQVSFIDQVTGREVKAEPDALVLSNGMRAPDIDDLAEVLKLPRTVDGFLMEAHAKLRPVDLSADGIFICGSCHGPKLVGESLAQAMAASSRAATLLSQKELSLSPLKSRVDPEKCASCLVCVLSCPYDVPRINEQGVSEIDPALCRGCGICASECPAKAIELSWYRDDQILCQVEAALAEL